MEIDFGLVPDESFLRAGRHFCRVTNADYEQSKGGDWGYRITLTCAHGEHTGKTMTDRVYASWNGDVGHKLVSRLKILARELGLLPDPKAKVTITPETLIGHEVWIEVEEGKPWVGNDGKERRSFQVGFAGYENAPAPAGYFRPSASPMAGSPPTPAPPAGSGTPQPGGTPRSDESVPF